MALSNQEPLRLRPRPSRILATMLFLLHGGGLLVIQPLTLPVWIKLLLSGAVLGSLVQNFIGHVSRRFPWSIVGLVWENSGDWELTRRDGKKETACLLPSSFVQPSLIVLNFRIEGSWRRPSVVLFRDAEDADTLRRLRVRMRK